MYIFTPKYDPRKISDKFTNNRSESTQQAAHELTDSCASLDYLSPPSSLPWTNKGIIKSPTTTTPANSLIIKVTKDMTKAQYQELRDRYKIYLLLLLLCWHLNNLLLSHRKLLKTLFIHPGWVWVFGPTFPQWNTKTYYKKKGRSLNAIPWTKKKSDIM